MAIELEKILTISLGEYCASVNKKPTDYRLMGVHIELKETTDAFRESEVELIERFADVVPSKVEVVIEYRSNGSIAYVKTTALKNNFWTSELKIASGTALIPKSKKKI